jgi:hypothetical protein
MGKRPTGAMSLGVKRELPDTPVKEHAEGHTVVDNINAFILERFAELRNPERAVADDNLNIEPAPCPHIGDFLERNAQHCPSLVTQVAGVAHNSHAPHLADSKHESFRGRTAIACDLLSCALTRTRHSRP